MKIYVDRDLCSGQGRCYTLAAELFSADEDGFVTTRGQTVEIVSSLEEAARRASRNCPERAIEVQEG